MSASNSPNPASQLVVSGDEGVDASAVANGYRSPSATGEAKGEVSPVPSIEGDAGTLPDAPETQKNGGSDAVNGEEDANSEAETLIDSPVKKREAEKREAEKQKAVVKSEKPQKSRIGSLPVPGDDDEDGDSGDSPMDSREVSVGKEAKEDVDMMDDDSDKENGSELSSAHSSPSNAASRASSRSRALSERPRESRNGTGSPNPRKRKHRASSMSITSNKRQSMEPPKRTRLRGINSEDVGNQMDRSPSPKRGHRRAVSTQSALDGTAEGSGRKRKGASSTYSGRDSKSAKAGWEESDASSEATSRGQDEHKRPARGIGRSTSTPGRPGGREHKRHVNKYGFTRLAEACEEGNLDLVREWVQKDPEQLELAEFAGNKPLQIAALNGNAEVVGYLIESGCQIDSANLDKDTPLIDAAENGHLEVVKLLLDAGVDPLRQNLKGQQALDVIEDDTEDATDIRAALHKAIDHWNSSEARQRREEEEEHRHRAGPSKELHFMARTYENLVKLVKNNDRNGVREFLAARVPVDNAVIAAAARTGDLYLLNMLLAEMNEKKAKQRPERPMLAVLGTSHFEMVKALTELESFQPLWIDPRSQKTWPQLAEMRNGPMWRQEQELLKRLYDAKKEGGGNMERRSSSPVTKRDGAKRRLQQAEAEDASEEEGGISRQRKRKNGRRLMSRKDMRAAGGRNGVSESSEEDDDEDANEETSAVDAADTKEEMQSDVKAPDTPGARRRLRSKSISSPAEISPKSLRKRSNSSRDMAEKAMPTLEEKGEEKDSGSDAIVLANEKSKKDKGEEAKLALQEAQRLDEKRKKEEEAEAEAKRAEEEVRRKEEERQAEEAREAAEQKAAEEAKKREEEAERIRKEEEERLEREREKEKARKRFISELFDILPSAYRHVLGAESTFNFDGEKDREFLIRQFTPLYAFQKADSAFHVFNLQAAPFLGTSGLDVFRSSEDSTLASEEVLASDLVILDRMLAQMDWNFTASSGGDETMHDVDSSFPEELQRAANRVNALTSARKRLRDNVTKIDVRKIELDFVRQNLQALVQGTSIDVEFVASPVAARNSDPEFPSPKGFVEKLTTSWQTNGSGGGGKLSSHHVERPLGGPLVKLTDVAVVHDKHS